jgi:hypothetical protein
LGCIKAIPDVGWTTGLRFQIGYGKRRGTSGGGREASVALPVDAVRRPGSLFTALASLSPFTSSLDTCPLNLACACSTRATGASLQFEFGPDSFGSVSWEMWDEKDGGLTLNLDADPPPLDQFTNRIPIKTRLPKGPRFEDQERTYPSQVCYRSNG